MVEDRKKEVLTYRFITCKPSGIITGSIENNPDLVINLRNILKCNELATRKIWLKPDWKEPITVVWDIEAGLKHKDPNKLVRKFTGLILNGDALFIDGHIGFKATN